MAQFTFKTWRDPYDACFSPCSRTQVTLNSGLTVLVGCNGSGKTTMLKNIKELAEKDNLPVYAYNNLTDGGSTSLSSMFYYGDFETGALMVSSSEGENICINLGSIVKNLKEFIETGETPKSKRRKELYEAFSTDDKKDDKVTSNIRFILLDAVDSGLSVDNVVMLKDIFEDVAKYAEELDKDFFVVISANEYELARNANCLDVADGGYIQFKDYEDYRNFIIRSRKKKEKRDKTAFVKQDKREQKRIERARKIALKVMESEHIPSYYKNDKRAYWISQTRDLCKIIGLGHRQIEEIVDSLIAENSQ